MTTIQYQENFSHGSIPSEIMDDRTFDLIHFSEVCGQSPEWVMQLIEHGILPDRSTTQTSFFLGEDISRAQRAYRLQRDFDASFSAVAMMLDLIDEVQELRREIKHLHFK
ncbi:chaperone modulator CbpM [Acinetobacter bohemicus]|uniref:Chaperone modulator CbpM n=1 Tax=Acinetobacter lwoffii TaxID=28090 RepID=A0A9D2US08_ACILW|nr:MULTISPECIES: chaperone modulator CbpM [Acinetobacter]MDM1781304.1 MerR family transcriptional regulator [Acinetobacter indicus]HJF27675.1 chaperone modulator CbpM [Acinetobacter lwoffii]MCO8042402.1 chaperone modulator CbpM [Acinetobacter sp. S4400-12]MCO8045607.1 chaperone modulator CbpM [Acinetobacter sp. S4397-1]MCU7224753.1 chaperone modulator CbpM [Acinetobacter bohemicus]